MTNDLKDAMLSLRKNRVATQTPESSAKATKPKAPARSKATMAKPKPAVGEAKANPAPTPAAALVPEIVGDDGENGIKEIVLKGQLTLKEQRFIELYLTGNLTVDKAMESAGYEGYHKKSLYRLGRKIVEKYESQAGEHRKIFRALGAGEVAVAQGLLKLATTARSEMVRLNAWVTIAKCMGLQKEVLDVQTGINIIIRSRSQAPPEPIPGGGRPALIHQAEPKAQPKMVSITD
jgi:hypothetical protein